MSNTCVFPAVTSHNKTHHYKQTVTTKSARCTSPKTVKSLSRKKTKHTNCLISFPKQWQISHWHNLHLWRHNFICRHGNQRWVAWRHCHPPLHRHRWEPLAYLLHPSVSGFIEREGGAGDSVTPHHRHHLYTQLCSRLLLSSPHRASPSRAEPRVLSVPDSYRLTLKHKRGERRNRQIDRQREDGNTNRVGGVGSRLSSSVIMLSISIFKSLLLLSSPFKIHQRKKK